MKTNAVWAIGLILIFVYLSQSNSPPVITPADNTSSDSGSSPNLANLVDAGVTFTGINKYLGGNSILTNELVRVFRLNGAREDLGTKSLNSGTLTVTPNVKYKFYFFMNASVPGTNYYVDVQDYTGKVQEASDDIVGKGCGVDSKPVITVRNPSGGVQTSRTNAYTIGAGSTADFEIDVKSHSDKCYGTPNAQKGNAICFGYDADDLSDITSNTNWVSPPRSITGLAKYTEQDTLKCYTFGLLEDASKDTLTVHLTTNGDPSNNISIFTDDIGFDLNKITLEEIWDYTDEDGNQLARSINATPDGFIFLS